MRNDIKCPKCGSKMIFIKMKKGSNTSKQSYQCERYPECKGEIAKDYTRPAFLDNIGVDTLFHLWP
jgi:ssDNA-binding Zn-finger/Zn-ribbon topoisomerase 1